MRFFQHHVFHLHQADLGGALVFVKLHRDVLDVRLQLRDHDVLQWLSEDGNDVNPEAVRYFLPLIQGEVKIAMKNGMPVHFKL